MIEVKSIQAYQPMNRPIQSEISTSQRYLRSGICWALVLWALRTHLAPVAFASGGAPRNAIEAGTCLTRNPAGEWDITGADDLTIQGSGTDLSPNVGQPVPFKINSDAST